jgi:putative flavoprotein involved in K+ transport
MPTSRSSAGAQTVVVGASQAGLATSYFLQRLGVAHVVLERGRIGESWRSQRWDSFVLNTPNALNGLPGAPYEGPLPDGFWHRDELVRSFERYARRFDLPIRAGVEVEAVAGRRGGGFVVHARTGTATEEIRAQTVGIASGMMRTPKRPPFAAGLREHIAQLDAASYRNPGALPSGPVLVVGSGQSGCQIAEELQAAGRTVYLSTSRVGRIPRRYRGRDVDAWLWESGFFDVRRSELADPSLVFATQPQVSGVGRHGHTLSLQQLASDGVRLLGRVIGIDGTGLILDDRLRDHIGFADRASAEIKRTIDDYIAQNGIAAAPPEDDPADRPWADLADVTAPSRLDLARAWIGTVIWCTGFGADFSWLRLPVLDERGRPVHERGVSPVPGLYFVGLPWLYKRKSGIICGVEEDAAHIARLIAARPALAA